MNGGIWNVRPVWSAVRILALIPHTVTSLFWMSLVRKPPAVRAKVPCPPNETVVGVGERALMAVGAMLNWLVLESA